MPPNTLYPEPEFTLAANSLAAADEVQRRSLTREPTSRPTRVAAFAVVLIAFGIAATYFLWPRTAPPPQAVAPNPPVSNPAAQAQTQPTVQHPVEQIAAPTAPDNGRPETPLPGLDNSDNVAHDVIETILNGDTYARLLIPNGIIRHIVATIDNLPRKKIAAQILPIVLVPGAFLTTNATRGTIIGANNEGRYAAYVKAAESIDTKRLAQFYVRLYPLFQQAFVELGYPDGYFNDRLISVIDHLLAAPEPKSPVYLSQPKVVFEFADPELEDLSGGQKILVRVGIGNEMRLKAKLHEVRKALTGKLATS